MYLALLLCSGMCVYIIRFCEKYSAGGMYGMVEEGKNGY